MSKEIIDRVRLLRTAMDSAEVGLENREEIQTNLVAALIAATIEVPSSRLEGNPKLHFVNINVGSVNEIIGCINEQVVINIDAVQTRVYEIWKERYELVHFPIKGVTAALKTILPEDTANLDFIIQVIGAR